MEKKKFEKVKETLTKTEEELKDLKKVWHCNNIVLQSLYNSKRSEYHEFWELIVACQF